MLYSDRLSPPSIERFHQLNMTLLTKLKSPFIAIEGLREMLLAKRLRVKSELYPPIEAPKAWL